MAKLNINIGASANDKTGDPLRTAFDKINQNFIELYAGGANETQLTNGSYTLTLGANGVLTFPNNSTFTGQTLTDVSGTTNYSLKIANGTTGSVFAVGTGTDAYGVANDALDHTQTTYVPYNATASTISFNIPGKVGSLTINANGVVTVPNGLVIPTGTKATNATGTAGQISYDSTYMYICISTNTWRRVALGGTY
jgi:hypothetical protein